MTNSETRMQDTMRLPTPDLVQLKGLLGERFHFSRMNRLRKQEEDHLLWPFQQHCKVGFFFKPEQQQYPGIRGDWQGEFLGTWLDAQPSFPLGILVMRSCGRKSIRWSMIGWPRRAPTATWAPMTRPTVGKHGIFGCRRTT